MKTIFTLLLSLVSYASCLAANDGPSEDLISFVYGYAVEGNFNPKGNLVQDSLKIATPTEGTMFEILFNMSPRKMETHLPGEAEAYNESPFPIAVKIRELNDDGKVVKEEVIGYERAGGKSRSFSVNFKSESVSMFLWDYWEVCVKSDGSIVIYEREKKKYVSAKMFKEKELEDIYRQRYEHLRGKLRMFK